ncbi:MAG: hypothetical protein H7Z19_03950 [Chitinophagaceae bacterium]|nr:hypothetical protein [Rubrivivax sp.]
MSAFRIAVATACLAVVAFPAGAQTAATAPPAASTGTPAKASKVGPNGSTYRSAFEGFRPFADQPVGSWRDANDTVGRVGGWRAYAREAAGNGSPDGHGGMHVQPVERPAAVKPAASGPGSAAAPPKGHAGHGSK